MPALTPYMVTPDHPGFSPNLSRLVSMMNYARSTTLQMAQGLTVEELDFLPDPGGNSIGMLLEHICAVEVGHQGETYGAGWDEAIGERWQAGAELGDLGREKIRGHGLRYYLENLKAVPAATYAEFARRDDAWLEEPVPMWGTTGNRFFLWFHVLEDEINHRGQIRLIWKQFPRFRDRGMMGLGLEAATLEGLGLRVSHVYPGSPAAVAGLQTGDLVTEFDGLEVGSMLYEEVPIVQAAGVTSRLKVRRGEELVEAEVTRVAAR
ncbi:MAG: DinB family protein [Meiothermus sp.]|nr:DinB family protein [Meiothermus sp.]